MVMFSMPMLVSPALAQDGPIYLSTAHTEDSLVKPALTVGTSTAKADPMSPRVIIMLIHLLELFDLYIILPPHDFRFDNPCLTT
jgi:hypothetical protein